MNTQTTEGAIYPRLLRRVRAVLIDEVLLLAVLAGWWLSIGINEDASLTFKISALVLVFFILDPVLVAVTGGTIGHHVMGMKVRGASRDEKASLLAATFRAIVRHVFGGVSLLLILTTRRHQAIHDYIAGTVVVLREPGRYPDREKYAERTT